MAYKALYRSYRPTNFGEVIGQRHVIQTLKNALKEDKISHAYVFCGLRGIGKTTVARILAKAVNCLNLNNGEPCNQCENCKAIDENSTTDIVELDAASNNGVDEIRGILDKINFLPSSLKKKVYIIDEVHMLSTSAFNALLKTLEEPPAYVMFVLATTEPHKIPMTILSRCQRFDFKQLTLEEITVEIELICEKEGISISKEAIGKIAESAEGGMRDALSILDQANVYADGTIESSDVDAITGNISSDKLIELIKSLNNDDANKAIELVNELLNAGKEVSRLITCVVQFIRDMLLYQNIDPKQFNKSIYKNEDFINLVNESDSKRLFYYIDVLVDVQNKIRFTNSQKIYLEVGIMRIINQVSEDLDILSKIQMLEEKINGGVSYSEDGISNPNSDQKLLVMDNKIKRLTSDIERMNFKGFKETVFSKINVLEDELSNHATIPLIQDRLTALENRLNEADFGKSIAVPEQNNNVVQDNSYVDTKADELKQEFNQIINEIREQINSSNKENNDNLFTNTESNPFDDSKFDSLEQSLNDKINMLTSQVDKIKAEVSNLRLSSSNQVSNESEEELTFPTKRINPYKYVEEEEKPNSSYDELMDKYNNIVVDLNVIKETSSSTKNELEEKINNLESKINYSNNEVLSQSLQELKTNYYLLSQTVAYMGTKQESNPTANFKDKIDKLENDLSLLYKEMEDLKNQKPVVQYIKEPVSTLQEEKVVENKEETPKENIFIEDKKEDASQNNSNVELVQPKEENNDQIPLYKKEDIFTEEQTPAVVDTHEEEKDITDKIYDVHILENILNEAFDKDARIEKDNLLKKWNDIEEKNGGAFSATARLVATGNLKACGKGKILIAYPTAQICNDIMTPNKHKEVCEILKIAFGKEYDFLALPDDVWLDKRMEYSNKRKNGQMKPELTPFNNPELRIIVSESKASISDKTMMEQKAKDFFGD